MGHVFLLLCMPGKLIESQTLFSPGYFYLPINILVFLFFWDDAAKLLVKSLILWNLAFMIG